MTTLFEQLGGVYDNESANNDDWYQMQLELRRPEATAAFEHMPPVVAMETWFNSDEYSELMSRDK